jgi:flavodoxin
MNTLVVYDSQFGNTERIAKAIADALHSTGQTELQRVDPVRPIDVEGYDLLVVGCPTQRWRATPAIQSWLASLTAKQLQGIGVACFDTRFQKSRWLTGSAAQSIGKQLRKRGATLLISPESFFVQATEGPLIENELQRAANWAHTLARATAETLRASWYG